jgi:CRISPR-associated protein Csx3
MPGTFEIKVEGKNILRVGFVGRAEGNQVVRDASARLDELISSGVFPSGGLVKINGPLSIPVALMLSHRLMKRFRAVGTYDRRSAKYIISASEDSAYRVGDLVD